MEEGRDPLDPSDDFDEVVDPLLSGRYLGGACGGCSTGAPSAGWLVGLLGLVGLRRRR